MQLFSLEITPPLAIEVGFSVFLVAIFFAKSNHPYPVLRVEVGGGQKGIVGS